MAETQAPRAAWSPPSGVLGELVADAERRAAEIAARDRVGARPSSPAERPRGFIAALRGASVAVIAEIKRRSPSKGSLDESLSAADRAAAYAAGGAAALSVLTQPSRFGGSLADLAAARTRTDVPLLRKDFIVRPSQIGEALAAGADAILLIARALEPSRADELAHEARSIGLDVLFEVRDESELARAVAVPGCAIGVNARNLETLRVDPEVCTHLIPMIPRDRVAVFESGVAGRVDVERAASLGADAVLVGSVLSAQADGAGAVAALAGVRRVGRA